MMKADRFSYLAVTMAVAFGASHIASARLNLALVRCVRETGARALPCTLSIDSIDDRSSYHLGLNAQRSGRPAEAVRDFSRALGARPKDELAAYFLGTSYRQAGDEKAALAVWRRYALGRVFRTRAWQKGELEDFQTAIAIGQVDAKTLFKFGDLLFDQGEHQRAAVVYQRGLSIESGDVDGLLAQGRLAEIAGDFSRSLAIYTRVVTVLPDDPAAYCRIAGIYNQMHEPGQAIAWASRASKRFPKEPFVFMSLARSYEAEKKFGDADRAYARAAELQPANFWIPYDRGRVALELGDRAQAEVYFRQSIMLNPTSPYLFVELGKTLQGSGRADDACSAFRGAIRLQPLNTDALEGLRTLSCR